jgi:hypothetical protein
MYTFSLVDEFKTARRIRTSAIYSELEARGAVFGERMGWERPLYFVPHHGRDDPPEQLPNLSFGKPDFFEHIEVPNHEIIGGNVGLHFEVTEYREQLKAFVKSNHPHAPLFLNRPLTFLQVQQCPKHFYLSHFCFHLRGSL